MHKGSNIVLVYFIFAIRFPYSCFFASLVLKVVQTKNGAEVSRHFCFAGKNNIRLVRFYYDIFDSKYLHMIYE